MGRLLLFAFAALAAVAFYGNSGSADDCGDGCNASPYYPTPSWDQKLLVADRFLVLADWNNQAVLDRDTGLVWETSPAQATFVWDGALQNCRARVLSNRRSWRLPSQEELTSLIDAAAPNPPYLPAGHPFQGIGPNDIFWTSSQVESAPGYAFVVPVSSPYGLSSSAFNTLWRLWCVRGGSATTNPH